MTEETIKFLKYCNTCVHYAKKQCEVQNGLTNVIAKMTVDYRHKKYSVDWVFPIRNLDGLHNMILSGTIYENIIDDLKRNTEKNKAFSVDDVNEVTVEIYDMSNKLLGKNVRTANKRGAKHETGRN